MRNLVQLYYNVIIRNADDNIVI